MKLRLIHKLLLAMFVCTALALVFATLVTRAGIGKGFVDFLQQQERSQLQQLVPELANWYGDHGNWEDLANNPRQYFNLLFATLPNSPLNRSEPAAEPSPPPPRGGRRGQGPPGLGNSRPGLGPRGGFGAGLGGRMPQRIFLLDGDKTPVIGEVPPDFDEDLLLPVEVDGNNVGWLGVAANRGIWHPEEEAFITQLRNNLLIGLAIGLVMAILLAWLLARHLSRPINEVAGGIRGLASGDFKNHLSIKGGDEIANLGDDLNRLSVALSEHETARKRWMSDMAHELRTPLAIINGELEAMIDGIRPLGREQLDSLRDEIRLLSALVNDLHNLAITDSGALAYKMHRVNLGDLVQLVSEASQGRAIKKGLELGFVIPEQPVRLRGDEKRLRQLLGNLLDNAIRYTDGGGRISVELTSHGQQAQLTISDTAPGASVHECEHLFERLYRLEGSRNRNSGGSGLGLAICRNIVEAHGGQITASPGPDGGLMITTLLPLEE